MNNEFKKCITCNEQKILDFFHKNPRMKSGRVNECKKCAHRRLQKSRNDPNKKKFFKQYQRNSKLKHQYGITNKQFNEMMIAQSNKCLICDEFQKTSDNKYGAGSILNVDHCHITKKIRGLLCHLCNRGIGLFRERIDLLEKAVQYLKKHN